jgi:tripartite-type tricarboxylate transporter receptor subunit TctC
VGPASGTKVNAIYFQNITGTRFQFVPHKSVQTAIKALTTGELDLLFDQASHSLSYLRAGTIKVFAVTSKTRTVSAPDVPTTDEGGLPGFHSANWYGLWAPKGTPKEIVVRINRAVVDALADPALVKQLSGQGLDMPPADRRTPEALGVFHRAEIEKWWPILREAGIKAK